MQTSYVVGARFFLSARELHPLDGSGDGNGVGGEGSWLFQQIKLDFIFKPFKIYF